MIKWNRTEKMEDDRDTAKRSIEKRKLNTDKERMERSDG